MERCLFPFAEMKSLPDSACFHSLKIVFYTSESIPIKKGRPFEALLLFPKGTPWGLRFSDSGGLRVSSKTNPKTNRNSSSARSRPGGGVFVVVWLGRLETKQKKPIIFICSFEMGLVFCLLFVCLCFRVGEARHEKYLIQKHTHIKPIIFICSFETRGW